MTSEAPTPQSGSSKLDYGYRPGTALVSLEYLLGRTDSMLGVEFIKAHNGSAFTRSPQDDCIAITSLSEDGGETMNSTVYALPGKVTVSGGDPRYEQSFTPTATTAFERGLDPGGHYFLGGEDVLFSSTGAEVPAFEVHQQFPLVLRLTEPAPSDGTFKISRDHDLNLSWTRGVANVDLYFDAFAGSSGVACRFDSVVGHAMIPRGLLTTFPSKTPARIFTLAYSHTKIGAFDAEIQIVTTVFYALPDEHSVYAELD